MYELRFISNYRRFLEARAALRFFLADFFLSLRTFDRQLFDFEIIVMNMCRSIP